MVLLLLFMVQSFHWVNEIFNQLSGWNGLCHFIWHYQPNRTRTHLPGPHMCLHYSMVEDQQKRQIFTGFFWLIETQICVPEGATTCCGNPHLYIKAAEPWWGGQAFTPQADAQQRNAWVCKMWCTNSVAELEIILLYPSQWYQPQGLEMSSAITTGVNSVWNRQDWHGCDGFHASEPAWPREYQCR